ncbi:uncharacterized protein [Anabrus simplex]|uniref:uncharacterized protein n=1 Tax=Anabrus simplex TaxID=316456 RepID=UPI0035A30457
MQVIRPNTTPSEVRIKIKNIRTQYSRLKKEINKSKKCGVGHEIYTPKLYFFDLLKFLDRFQKCTPPDFNITSQQMTEPEEIGSIHNTEAPREVTNTEAPREVTNTEILPKLPTKRKNPSLEEEARKALKMVESRVNVKEDGIEVFSRFVASELRNIKDQRILQNTKWKIQHAIMEGIQAYFDISTPSQSQISTLPFVSSPSATEMRDITQKESADNVAVADRNAIP